VFWFSLHLPSWTFLILNRIERDMIINMHCSSCKVPIILVRISWNFNFLERFSRNPHISNFMKILPVGAESFHADGRTGGQTWHANSRLKMHVWKQEKTNKKHWRKNKYLWDIVAVISFGLPTTKVCVAVSLHIGEKMNL